MEKPGSSKTDKLNKTAAQIVLLLTLLSGSVLAQEAGNQPGDSETAAAVDAPVVEDPVVEEELREPVFIGKPLLLNEFGEAVPSATTASATGSPVEPLTIDPETLQEAELLGIQAVRLQEENLQRLELAGGAWHADLANELMTLGGLMRSAGEPERAVEIYTRAAHINRINFGLNSVEQIPALQELIDTLIELEQWQEADRQHRNAFYIQTRAYDRNDPRLIPALESMASWNMKTFNRGIIAQEEEPVIQLLEAYRLYAAATQLVDIHFGYGDPRYISYLRNMAGTAFRLAVYGAEGEIDRAMSRSTSSFAMNQATGSRAVRVSGFAEGEEALTRIVDFYTAELAREKHGAGRQLAQAKIELGDWHLLFSRRQTAYEFYTEAWKLLVASGGTELATETFDQIVALPAYTGDQNPFETSNQEEDLNVGLREGHVDVSLSINSYGRSSGVDLLSVVPEDHNQAAIRVVRSVRSMLFRPRFRETESIDVEQISLRVPYWY